jgi:hypothetical protein
MTWARFRYRDRNVRFAAALFRFHHNRSKHNPRRTAFRPF